MVTYYAIVNKNDVHKISGLLPSEKFGVTTIGDFPFATSQFGQGRLNLYQRLNAAQYCMNPKTNTILKIECEDFSSSGNKGTGNTLVCKHYSKDIEKLSKHDDIAMRGNYVDSSTRLNIVGQVLANGKERTKEDALKSELNPILKAANFITKKVVGNDAKEMSRPHLK